LDDIRSADNQFYYKLKYNRHKLRATSVKLFIYFAIGLTYKDAQSLELGLRLFHFTFGRYTL